MKQLLRKPMLSLIMLVLALGTGICVEWTSWRAVLLVPIFLLFLLFLVVLLRQRLRKTIRAGAVNQAKAEHVS
jgi:hypothetical protein